MINEALKQSFIEDRHSRNRKFAESTVVALFDFAEQFERKFNKDVAYFDVDQALEMIKARGSRSLNSLQNSVVTLAQYSDFVYLNTGEKVENAYRHISKEHLEDCLSADVGSVLLSRERINELQSQMYNAVDCAILECLFCGISGKNLEDLTSLCENDLDLSTQRLRLQSGKIVELTDRQCDLLIAAFDETESTSYLDNNITTVVFGKGRLYKEKANAYKEATADRKFRWVLRRVVIWKEHFGLPVLTMKSIATSGLVDALQVGMRETQTDLRALLKSPRGKEIAEQYGFMGSEHYVDVILNKVKRYFQEG